MADTPFDERTLVKILDPIEPYLENVVLCGGWTLFVYRKWVLGKPGPLPLRTADVDVAVPKKLPVKSKPVEELLKQAGFREELSGSGKLPVMQFRRKDAPYIEFLTPRKSTKDPEVVAVQSGVTAQVLQYLDIVLENPHPVKVPGRRYSVRVPTAAAYLYQKGLSFRYRSKREHMAKDLAYMFELLNNFPELRKRLPGEVAKLGRKTPSWFRTFKLNLRKRFPSGDSEAAWQVVEQQPHPYAEFVRMDPTNGRSLLAQTVYNAFGSFLDELG